MLASPWYIFSLQSTIDGSSDVVDFDKLAVACLQSTQRVGMVQAFGYYMRAALRAKNNNPDFALNAARACYYANDAANAQTLVPPFDDDVESACMAAAMLAYVAAHADTIEQPDGALWKHVATLSPASGFNQILADYWQARALFYGESENAITHLSSALVSLKRAIDVGRTYKHTYLQFDIGEMVLLEKTIQTVLEEELQKQARDELSRLVAVQMHVKSAAPTPPATPTLLSGAAPTNLPTWTRRQLFAFDQELLGHLALKRAEMLVRSSQAQSPRLSFSEANARIEQNILSSTSVTLDELGAKTRRLILLMSVRSVLLERLQGPLANSFDMSQRDEYKQLVRRIEHLISQHAKDMSSGSRTED